MRHISKIKPRFVQYANIIIMSKHNQVWDFMATVGVIRLGVMGCFNDFENPGVQ